MKLEMSLKDDGHNTFFHGLDDDKLLEQSAKEIWVGNGSVVKTKGSAKIMLDLAKSKSPSDNGSGRI